MREPPALVTVHLWGVRGRDVPRALLRMGLDRGALRRTAGLRFAKLVGTGRGQTFTPRDADPRHWGVIAAWDSTAAAARFESGQVATAWGRLAEERLRLALRPIASRGSWAGRTPFGAPLATPYDLVTPYEGAVAALTRARIAPRHQLTFWRSVPPVTRDLARAPGLRLAVGIGEAPIGLQGTLSLWDSGSSLTAFAHRGAAHVEAVRRTGEIGWYTEELFARFAVLHVEGTHRGRHP